jgi:hypothetical protein
MPFQFRKEAIEEDLNSNFPSQGQGNPPLYYSLSEVVIPTYSINQVAEGSSLPENLQTAWDFSTGHATVSNTTTTVINNTGFWQVDLNCVLRATSGTSSAQVQIDDGISTKIIWEAQLPGSGATIDFFGTFNENKFTVFLRSGDSLTVTSASTDARVDIWYRQIADITGNLVNPLGFSFA